MRTVLFLLVSASFLLATSCSSNSSSSPRDGGAGGDAADDSVRVTDDGFAWAQSFEAGNGSTIMAMASDATGVVLVGHIVTSATFGTTTLTGTNGSQGDAFVAKLDPNGNPLWAKVTTGSSGDFETVVIDPSGNILIGGDDFGDSPSLTLGSTTLTPETGTGGGTIFQLDPNGNVIWGKLIATTGEVNVSSLAISGTTIYAAGPIIDDAAFASGGAMAVTNCGTAGCVYLAAYDASGNIQWAKQAPSSPHRGTGVDPREVWLAANGTNLDLAIGGSYSSAGGLSNDVMELVVSQYDLTGALTWTKVTQSQDAPTVNGLVLDSAGNAYVAGSSAGLQLGAISVMQYAAPFLVKYTSTGDLAWGIGFPSLDGPADTALALTDHLVTFGNGGANSPIAADRFDLATGALVSEVPCAATHGLGQAVAASSLGVFVGGYGGPPSTFGTKTLSALGLFVAKLK